jgi:hypothetical protein
LDRKLGAAAPRAGGLPEDDSSTSGAQRALLSLLEMALGAREAAQQVVARGLVDSGRSELPTSGLELVAFVRAHLLEPLSDHIGARLTMALVTDLEAQLDPTVPGSVLEGSVPPTSLTRSVRQPPTSGPAPHSARAPKMAVVLIDGDRVGRTTLARALLRGECEVMVADLPADLEAALDAADPVDVALVDANHPAAIAIVELLAQRRPGVPLVVRTGDPVGTLARLAQVTAAKVDVRPRHAAADELIDAMRRTLAG